jgi:TonB family protein
MLGTMLLIIPMAVFAQSPVCPLAAGDTVARAISQVGRRPVADSANAPPWYNDLFVQAGIGGVVHVAFTVDTVGRVEGATIRIMRSPNPGFDVAVKRAVATWRYAPASLCAHPVRVRLDHEFAFQPVRDTLRLRSLFDAERSVAATTDTLPDGTPRTTVVSGPTPVAQPSVSWASAALDSAEEAALAHVIDDVGLSPSGMARVVCLAGPGGALADPDSGRLVRLARAGIAILPSRRCPRTFASMRYNPGERPHPPGEDPFEVRVSTRAALSPTRVLFDVEVLHATGGNRHRCGVERRDGAWRVRCLVISSWVS